MIARFIQRTFLIAALIAGMCIPVAAQPHAKQALSQKLNPGSIKQKLAGSALLFTENKGQVADEEGTPRTDILFSAHSEGVQVFLSANGLHYQFTKLDYPAGYEPIEKKVTNHARQAELRGKIKRSTHRFSLSLEGANPAPTIRKEAQSAYTENYYFAHCPQGITGVHGYERVVYENVYPGIDWVIYSSLSAEGKAHAGIKYDFVVHPGADYRQIKLVVDGAEKARISAKGDLLMETSLGSIREAAPESFCDGMPVPSKFVLNTGTVTFSIGAYDRNKDLVIDPSVSWSTYYGVATSENGVSCSADKSNNVFLAGLTPFSAATIASSNGFQTVYGGGSMDAFLVKFDSTGARKWATYYGGSSYDNVRACATDRQGNVYMSGETESTTGLSFNGHQNTYGGGPGDGYLVKFDAAGLRVWATYYGGTGEDMAGPCTTDTFGNVYIAGSATSTTGIAFNGYQNTIPVLNAASTFIAKFSSAGVRQWGTYYAGYGFPAGAEDCTTDPTGNIFIAGTTLSSVAIASGGHQNTLGGGSDAYLLKFNGAGGLIWATYYGGSLDEYGYGCATDKSGNVFLSGTTQSLNNIAANGYSDTGITTVGAFLVKFSPAGTRQWGTYYGYNGSETGYSCATDKTGNVYLAGSTAATSNVAFEGFQNTLNGALDAYIVKFTTNGSRVWASYFGGNSLETGFDCVADTAGYVYLTGSTNSVSGLSYNGFQNTYGGVGSDAFLAKISPVQNTIIVGQLPAFALCAGSSLNIPFTSTVINNTGNVYTAQLSNAAGSFAAPVNIGSLSSTANTGVIAATIPAGTLPGSGYRVRVVSSVPVLTGLSSDSTITISNALPPQPGPISGNTPVCAGTPQTYSITAVPGTASYSWTLPATWSGSSNTTAINAVAGTSGGIISVTATNVCGTSAPATLSVVSGTNITLIPSVTITTNNPLFCTAVPTIFTAVTVNGGNSPAFQWKKNGVNVGFNMPTYTDPSPQTGTVITVQVISNAPCAASGAVTSNAITENVSATVVPGININTIPPSVLCQGTPIIFVSNITGGGSTPVYKWYKNGVLIPTATSSTYTDASLQNGDTVQAVLIPSDICATIPIAYSNKRGVTVLPVVAAQVSISASPGTADLPIGTPVTFTAVSSGGGASPVFTWRKNNVIIPNVTGPVYTISFTATPSGLSRNDEISVELFSNAPCPSSALVLSNVLKITSSTGIAAVSGTGNWAGSLVLHPNPNNGHFVIEADWSAAHIGKSVRIALLNTLGQKIYATEVVPDKPHFSVGIRLDDAVANGLYQLRIATDDMHAVKPVVIRR